MKVEIQNHSSFTKNPFRKTLVLSLIASSLFFSVLSCKKKANSPADEPEEAKDEIVYSEFKMGINVQSVVSNSLINAPCGTYTRPYPSDSSASYKLDVNGDQVADFILTANHNLYTGSEYCGHCPSYNYLVSISGLNPDASVAVQNTSPGAKIFSQSTSINTENIWANSVVMRSQQCTTSWDFGSHYIGFKIGSSFGYMRVHALAANGIQITEIGFNKTANRAITCGQKQ